MINTIKTNLDEARKGGYKKTAMILNVLYADAIKVGKDKRNDLPTDEECIQSAKKIIKGCKETIEHLKKSEDQQNLQIEELENEIETLEHYLPKQLTQEEIIDIIKSFDELNIGVIMKHMKENYSNQYNGKEVSFLINQLRGKG